MLKEITLQEFLERMGDVRIMVDEDPDQEEKEPTPDMKAERVLKSSSPNEQKVLKAWNRGERTIKEVMEITGLSYPTVRKYLPATPNG